MNPARARQLIHAVRGGTVLFAYAAPAAHDPHVNHSLSSSGEKLYDSIEERA